MTDTCLPKKRAIFCFSKHPPDYSNPPDYCYIEPFPAPPIILTPPPFIRYSRVLPKTKSQQRIPTTTTKSQQQQRTSNEYIFQATLKDFIHCTLLIHVGIKYSRVPNNRPPPRLLIFEKFSNPLALIPTPPPFYQFLELWNDIRHNFWINARKKSQEVHSTEPEFESKCISNISVHIDIWQIRVYLRKGLFSVSPSTPPPRLFQPSRLLLYRAISSSPDYSHPPPRLFGTREYSLKQKVNVFSRKGFLGHKASSNRHYWKILKSGVYIFICNWVLRIVNMVLPYAVKIAEPSLFQIAQTQP